MLRDNFGTPQVMYCTLFTESWDASYGTVEEVYYEGGEWTVGAAFAYTNATYAATYSSIGTGSYTGGNCGGWGAGSC